MPVVLIVAGLAILFTWPFLREVGFVRSLLGASSVPWGNITVVSIAAGLILTGLVLLLLARRGVHFVPRSELDAFVVELLSRRGYEFPPEGVSAHGLVRARHAGGGVLIDLRAVEARRVGARAVRQLMRELRRAPEVQRGVLLTQGGVSDRARVLARNDRIALVDVRSLQESLERPPERPRPAVSAPTPRRKGSLSPERLAEDDFPTIRRSPEPSASVVQPKQGEMEELLSRPSGSPPRAAFDAVEARLRVENPGESQFGRRRDRPREPADWDDLLSDFDTVQRPAPAKTPNKSAPPPVKRPDFDPWGDGE